MTLEDEDYIEDKIRNLLVDNYSVRGVLSLQLLNIIKRETDGDLVGYMLDRFDTDVEVDESDVVEVTELSKDTLINLLTVMLNGSDVL